MIKDLNGSSDDAGRPKVAHDAWQALAIRIKEPEMKGCPNVYHLIPAFYISNLQNHVFCGNFLHELVWRLHSSYVQNSGHIFWILQT